MDAFRDNFKRGFMISSQVRQYCAAATAIFLLGTAHGQTPGVMADTLVLGRILPFTGVLAPEAKIYAEGQNIYFDRINKAGGINGRKILVMDYDNAYAADKAGAAATIALTKDQVLLLIGGLGTANGLTIAAVAEQNKTALIGTTTGAVAFREPARRYIFPIRPSASDAVSRMVTVGTRIGWETYAAVYQDDAFGKDALSGLQAGTAREKSTVIATVPVNRAATEYSAAVATAVASKASVVMVFLPPVPATKFIRALKESNFTGSVATLSINGIPAVIKGIGDKSRGLALPRVLPRPNDKSNPLAADFMKVMKEGGNIEPTAGHFEAFVTACIVVEALKRGGRNINREAIVTAMESLGEYDMGGFRVTYGPNLVRLGNQNNIELQVVGKGGGFVY